MITRYLLFITISLLIFVGFRFAYALEWSDISASLKSQNIDPNQLNWSDIDQQCRQLERNQTIVVENYGECRLRLAKIQHQQQKLKESCLTQSRSSFPDSLLFLEPEITQRIIEIDQKGNKRFITVQKERRYSETQLAIARQQFFDQCTRPR
jgi:hypothetical protein